MKSYLIAAALLALCVAAPLASGRRLNEEDASHRGPESPAYEVVNITSGFEVREYANATWAVSFGRSRWATDLAALQAGFGLAKYLTGSNTADEPIDITIPLLGTVTGRPPHPHPHPPHGNGSHCGPDAPPHKNGSCPRPHPPHPPHPPPPPAAVAVAAFIPRKYEGEPPLPYDRRVRIVHTNATTVYTRKFGGYAFSWVVRHQVDRLAHALKDAGICPFKGKFFSATYELSLWKLFGRTNEVWWVAFPHHGNHSAGAPPSRPETAGAGLELLDPVALFPEEFEAPKPLLEPELPEPAAAAWEVSEGQEATPEVAVAAQQLEAQAAVATAQGSASEVLTS